MKLRTLSLALALIVGGAGVAEAGCPNGTTINLAADGNGNGCVIQADLRGNGSIASATANAALVVQLDGARGSIGWQITGLTASGATLTPEYSDDGSTWFGSTVVLGAAQATALTADGTAVQDAAHHVAVRLRVSATGTGSIAVVYSATANSQDPLLRAAISVSGTDIIVTSTPAVQNAAYVSGNCIGGFGSVALASANGGAVDLTAATLKSVSGQTPNLTLYVFDSSPSASTCTDRGTFTLNSADVTRVRAIPSTLTPVAPLGATASIARQTFSPPAMMNAGGSTGSGVKTVYYALVAGSTFTPGSTSDIQVTFEALH